MWVVKLGGSLAESDALIGWLSALAKQEVVIVPGGGPFADAVRAAQTRWRFDDRSAHDMAILAMQQYGRLLQALRPDMSGLHHPSSSTAKIDRCTRVWLPHPETLAAAGLPASWNITSDSLAAWLAKDLGASRLLLVKSVDPAQMSLALPSEIACDRLIDQGLIDPAFRDFGRFPALQSWWCGPGDHNRLPEALSSPDRSFIRIRFDT